jgi:DNA polymerase III subunit gamma/tau
MRIIRSIMGQALYRKNRPKSLRDVVGQEHITRTLGNALRKGTISHAYLFTGPRGVGKTSVARILAHEINGLPYEDDSTHLDIIEIDAASNRRIDEIRDLRDRVNVAPTSAKYKVYIIDEVHMLTREAFNALLKTLEEPPAHVVFILATTEVHKLPETIISRTQRFTFKPVTLEKVVAHLRDIARQENIRVSDGALELIARHGEGSFRDSISLLDQAGGHEGEVDETYVEQLLGIPPLVATTTLLSGLDAHDPADVIRQLAQLHEHGYNAAQIAKQLGGALRGQILEHSTASSDDLALLRKLLDVPAARDPQRYLEIVLLEYALLGGAKVENRVPEHKSAQSSRAAKPSTPPTPAKSSQARAETAKATTKEQAETKKPTTQSAGQKAVSENAEPASDEPTAVVDDSVWPQVLAELKKKHNTLYGVVRMAEPTFREGALELGFGFAFHRKRLSEPKNQAIIADIIQRLTGNAIAIECVESEAAPNEYPEAAEIVHAVPVPDDTPTEVNAPQADIANISNIFGGGELLES